jgi:hypothetical protein
VLSHFVMMNSFAVVVCRCLVMPSCIVVVLAGGVFHGHGMVLSKSVLTVGGRPFRKNSGKRCLRRHRAMRLRRAADKLPHCCAGKTRICAILLFRQELAGHHLARISHDAD